MARRDDDNIFALAAELPWWVGLGLAVFSCLVMYFVVPAIPTTNVLWKAMLGASPSLSWFVAGGFLVASLASGLRSLSQVSREGSFQGSTAGPVCPQCGGTLVVRRARKGAHAGDTFLGCSNFPKCRYIANRS